MTMLGTISDLLAVLGAVAGVAVLVVMAFAPLLLELPVRARRAEPVPASVVIPAQRTASLPVVQRQRSAAA